MELCLFSIDQLIEAPKHETVCIVDGCDRSPVGRGLCRMHYMRRRRTGSAGNADSMRDGNINYRSAHNRVKKLWGVATQYQCVECDKMAHHWAYDGTDTTELLGHNVDSWNLYSRWPEFYAPMCRKCHRKKDDAKAKNELYEYRLAKINANLSH